MARQFVIVTEDLSGFGWVKKLQEEGEAVVLAKVIKPDDKPDSLLAGSGLMVTESIEQAIATRCSPETYWIFDRNCVPEIAEDLRSKSSENVLGSSLLTARMENDRAYAVAIAADCGLPSPPTYPFTDIDSGVVFLEAHPDVAYVLKPNASEDSYTTFVPMRDRDADANCELLMYLRNVEEAGQGYILQERKAGVEVNVELWLYDGAPFFAMCDLENKRRQNNDLGEMSGCAADIVFTLPLDAPILARTVGKMLPFYAEQRYTGFADVNVILGDNQTWFLEVCNRFGYNAHPNLFLTCALDGFGSILADWMDGEVHDLAKRFCSGFGASVTLFIDHPRPGIPLHFDARSARHFYPFDGYLAGGDVLLTGMSSEVGIFTDHDYTIEDAAESVLTKLLYTEAVSFPDMSYRTDLASRAYPHSVLKRYDALRAMRLI